MRRTLVGIGIALAVIVVAWIALDREPRRDSGASTVERTPESELQGAPRLEGQAPLPEPEAERPGPASIHGTVTRDGEPARARVEIRKGRYNFGVQGSLTRLPYGEGKPIGATDSAEDGTYRIEGLEVGEYEVTARADDGALAWARGFCHVMDPHSEIRLVLEGGAGVLVGRAVHADGTPFCGFAYAYVGGHPRHGATTPMRPVPTDEEGRFCLEGLPEGEVDLALVKPEITQSVFGNVAVPQLAEREFIVEDGLEIRDGTVVTDDTGKAIVGALISWDTRIREPRRRFVCVTETDAAGAFSVRVRADAAGTLWVRAEGFATMQIPVKPETSLALRMKRFGRVIGRVVEKEGARPVAGARIHGWNWGGWDMKSPLDVSAADGTFTAQVAPGDGMIYVLDERWVSDALSKFTQRGQTPSYVEAGAGETAEVVLGVVRTGAVHGTVRDAAGRPLAGVLVLLAHPPRWEGFSQVWGHEDVCTCVTDEEGHYRIGALIPGFPYHVTARPAEGPPAESDLVTAASGEEIDVDLRVPAALHLDVRVLEKGSGRPVPGAHVHVRQGRHSASARTADDGIARVEPLLPEPVTVHVRCEGYISPTGEAWMPRGGGLKVEAPTPDAEPVVVKLTKGVTFVGRILTADGSPWTQEGMLTLHPTGTLAGRGLGLVGGHPLQEGGAFRSLGPVPPGTYDVILTDGEITNRKLHGRWTVSTETSELTLRVDPSQAEEAERNRVVIQVVDPHGNPVLGWIRVYGASGRYWGWILPEEGYAPVGLEPGTIAWVLVHGGRLKSGEKAGGIWAGPLEMKAGANRIQLDPPRKLAGQVTGPDGTPVAGLRLLFAAVPPEDAPYVPQTFALPRARTDAAGRFEIEGLAPGAHRVLLVPSDEYALLRPVTAMAGRDDVEIRLELGTAADIRIVGTDEAPVAGAIVKAVLDGVPDAEREAVTDEKGKARLVGLSPRTAYDLTVEPPDSRNDLAGAWRQGWVPASAEIPLHAGRVIRGTVLKGDAPFPGGTVWWKDRRGLWRRAYAARTGMFRITALSDSEVTLRAGERGGVFDVRRAGEPVVVGVEQSEVELRVP